MAMVDHLKAILNIWILNGVQRNRIHIMFHSRENCSKWECNYQAVWLILNGFWQNGGQLSRFQMVGLPDFRSHLKSEQFVTHSLFDHFDFRSPLYLDPRCKLFQTKSTFSTFCSPLAILNNFKSYIILLILIGFIKRPLFRA